MPATAAMSRAVKATSGMFFSELTVPVVIAESPKVYDLKDMPFKLVNTGQTTASLKSVLIGQADWS
eukprot:4830894-Amphidinium_carterae.3